MTIAKLRGIVLKESVPTPYPEGSLEFDAYFAGVDYARTRWQADQNTETEQASGSAVFESIDIPSLERSLKDGSLPAQFADFVEYAKTVDQRALEHGRNRTPGEWLFELVGSLEKA